MPPPPRAWPRRDALLRPWRSLVQLVGGDEPPLELQLVGRVVLQAIAVGLTVGAAGCLLLVALDAVEALLLGEAASYPSLHAVGEHRPPSEGEPRWWLIALLPCLGALAAGYLARWAPEVRGGGGDAMIDAFHHHGGRIRRRVVLLKPLASILTLGTGGAGGREGPTMHLGGALGAWVASLMPTGERERRVLMIAGVAAGISAVFRTPLGAALLAIEVLYRDDFEAEALIPAVLASVVAYALSSTLLTPAPMFGRLPAFPFYWEHLPLYALEAIAVAAAAAMFVAVLRAAQRATGRLKVRDWMRPAIGGLALGLLAVATIAAAPRWLDVPSSHLAVLGGGYGHAQIAITGDEALGVGPAAALVLIAAALLRAIATSLTVGTGGSAGDFAPSLAIGALVGGAFGHLAVAWLAIDDLSIGAFAMVGMATFYGGIAKVPLAATVMVCEMAGSYDLLVPLMLAQAIAFVALRRVTLYPAQLAAQRHSPAHAAAWVRRELARLPAGELLRGAGPPVVFHPRDGADRVLRAIADAPKQSVFPVVDDAGAVAGLVTVDGAREIAAADDVAWAVAADLMVAAATVSVDTPLAEIARALIDRDLRAIPVVDAEGRLLGLVDEHDVSRAYVGVADESTRRATTEMRAVAPPPERRR